MTTLNRVDGYDEIGRQIVEVLHNPPDRDLYPCGQAMSGGRVERPDPASGLLHRTPCDLEMFSGAAQRCTSLRWWVRSPVADRASPDADGYHA